MRYNVNGACVTVIEDEVLVAGSVKIHHAEFVFDDSWDEYTKIAVFKNGTISKEQILKENVCEIPWEVLKHRGELKVGIFGITNEKRRPTLWASLKSVNDGAERGGESREPTPDIFQQLLNRVENEMLDAIKEHDSAASAHESLKTTATALTLTPGAWVDDSDTYTEQRKLRVAYRTKDEWGAADYICGVDETGEGNHNPILLTYEWQDYILPFTLAEAAPRFRPFLQGWVNGDSIQPYDIMAAKLYAADDKTKTNLLSDDIEAQDWQSHDGRNISFSDTALFITDGVKYRHVFRQEANYAEVGTFGTIPLTAGNYVLELRLRLTPWLKFCSVPAAEAHSENCVTVSPSIETADTYASHNISCEAFGSERLIFSCDEIPSTDVKVNAMVTKSNGAEGLIFQPMRSSVYVDLVDEALLDTIGSGVIE